MIDLYSFDTPNGQKVRKRQQVDLSDRPHVRRWLKAVGARPAVAHGPSLYARSRDAAA